MKTTIIINGETYYYDKGATNHPKGYAWFNNHKSRFTTPYEFKQVLVNKNTSEKELEYIAATFKEELK